MATPPPTFPCKRCGEELWSLAQVDGLATCPKCRTANTHDALARSFDWKFLRRHRLLILSPLLVIPVVAILTPTPALEQSSWQGPLKAFGIIWCLWCPALFAFVFGMIRYARRRRVWPTILVAMLWYVVSGIVMATCVGLIVVTGAGFIAGG